MAARRAALAPAGDVLLRVSANPDADHSSSLAVLSESDWQTLLERADESRLVPILARAIERAGNRIAVPEAAAGRIAEEKRWHDLNALRQQAALVRLVDALSALDLKPIALKGVALAHGAYPAPALRPKRDLDVLLPAEQAGSAQRALIATGAYTVHPDLRGTLRTSPEHYPPLQDAALAVTIELHHRIGTWAGADVLQSALVQSAAARMIGGVSVVVPSPEANLLHLTASAVIKDRLALSALVLADLHYLAAGGIDWDRVGELAGSTGLRKPLALLGGLAERFGAEWVPPLVKPLVNDAKAHADVAAQAMLRPASIAERQKIVERVARATPHGGGGRGVVSLALAPEPVQLARMVGVSSKSPWRWAGYPAWLAHRTFAYTRGWLEARRLHDADTEDMRAWLAQEQAARG